MVLVLVFFAYSLGSLSAAIITCRLMGLPDPRTQGSNNPGATNVLRIGGKKAAAITLFGDALKGFIPTYIAILADLPHLAIAAIALCAFLGHLFPIFFNFKGGKGVATSLGVLLAIDPLIGLILMGIWLLVAYGLKISSLSAIIAALFAPLLFWFMHDDIYFAMSCLISAMLLLRHKQNIKNLLVGEEDKVGDKEDSPNEQTSEHSQEKTS